MKPKQTYSKSFLKKLKTVQAKRPKTVIDHILKHGQINTDELKSLYGYNHPPRAARDVREHGIALTTNKVKGADGRMIGEYRLDEKGSANYSKRAGRTVLSSKLKEQLIAIHGSRCFIYLEIMPESELQIDHRVPYEVAGDRADQAQESTDFMLLCGSANRAKSWSCEHCSNSVKTKKIEICQTCYWASPEDYKHVAMQEQRRVDVIWRTDEIQSYEQAKIKAATKQLTLPDFVKDVLNRAN